MPYDPKSIANYFLDLGNQSGQALSPMKLQKLVFYAHGWYAGHTGEPLINEEIEAWQFGPVIPSLYHEFKRYGAGPITSKANEFVVQGKSLTMREVPAPEDANLRNFLNSVWNSYSKFTAVHLSAMTHAANGPWDVTRRTHPGIKGADIPFDLIKSHFAEAVANMQHQT